MRRVALVLTLGFGLVVAAWVVGNPPFAAPDEPAQYIRALALAGGDLGDAPHYPMPAETFDEEWFRRQTRVVDVPEKLVPRGQLPCFAFSPTVTADCDADETPFILGAADRLALDPRGGLFPMIARLDVFEGPTGPQLRSTSYQGTYPPLALLAPGLGAHLGSSPESGNLFARGAAAALFLAFIGAGWAWLLDTSGLRGPRLIGGLLALTPMTLFVGATVSGASLEVAAAFAWACGLVRSSRGRLSVASVVGLGVVGGTLAAARQIRASLARLDRGSRRRRRGLARLAPTRRRTPAGDRRCWRTDRRRISVLDRLERVGTADTAPASIANVARGQDGAGHRGPRTTRP